MTKLGGSFYRELLVLFLGFLSFFVGTFALGELFAPLALIPLLLWPFALLLDVNSTLKIHGIEPEHFTDRERNKFFAGFVAKFGFFKALILFLALVELPTFIFLSLFFAPFLASYLPLGCGYITRFGSAAAFLAFAHLQAWRENEGYLGGAGGLPRR